MNALKLFIALAIVFTASKIDEVSAETRDTRATVAALPLALVAIGAGVLVTGLTLVLFPAIAEVAITAIGSLSPGAAVAGSSLSTGLFVIAALAKQFLTAKIEYAKN